jgi:hypothetical protein
MRTRNQTDSVAVKGGGSRELNLFWLGPFRTERTASGLLRSVWLVRLRLLMRASACLVILSLWSEPGRLLSAQPQQLTNMGFIYDHSPLTLEPGHRTEILGPLFNLEQKDSEKGWAFPPFLSYRSDAAADFEEFDLAYPLLTFDRFGAESRFQILQLFSLSGSQAIEDDSRKNRVTLFPFFFYQHSTHPDQDYSALFPFYGRLKGRVMRDEIRFILFPLYLQTRKKDVVTDNYLFPIFHRRRGEAMKGWQVWPLGGVERKEATKRTNQLDEIEIVGGHKKTFVLWPFYFNNDLGIGTDNPQTQRVLLPFYSLQRSPLRDSSSYLWPLGFTYTEDREKKYREWDAPWPFVVFARGEGKTANRIWPLFSQARNSILQSDFYLWPLYKYNRATAEPLDRERTRILLFLYSDLTERNTTTGTALRRKDLWPLFTVRREHNGNERLQILSLLEPLVPNNKGIERNYSPLWSVWRSEKNGKSGNTSQSLLWNLYRRDTTPTTKKCSLLFGLFRYQSGPEGKHLRLFYLPVGKAPKTGTARPPT